VVRARREASDAILITVLLDTNILLDVILDRTPWADDATALLDKIAKHEASGSVAAHAVTTVYYLVERAKGRAAATTAVSDLLDILDVVALEGADFRQPLALGLEDCEDAVQAACLKVGARFLVRRNERDFKGAPITPGSAAGVLAFFAPIDNT
jgi:predicted nucleic acid-binding protein